MFKYAICFALLALARSAPLTTFGLTSLAGNREGGIVVPHGAAAASNIDEDTREPPIAIVRSESDRKPDGSFEFTFEGADGSFREEKGQVVHHEAVLHAGAQEEEEAHDEIEVSGSYRYYDADGQLIEVHYTAGKNGFIPRGTNIPAEISEAAQAASDAARENAQVERSETGRRA